MSQKIIQVVPALAILLSSQIACQTVMSQIAPVPTATEFIPAETQTPSPVPPPSPTPTPSYSDEEIKAGIQASLNIYARALTDNNPDLLDQVVDQENKPFRRIVRSRFDEYQNSTHPENEFSFTLVSISRRDFGYVIAEFTSDGGSQADWPFRKLGENWVITEPTVAQIGEPVVTDTEHFTFTTYPWADDVNQQTMDMMEIARSNVEQVLGEAPKEKANVTILPIYGLNPFNPMNAVASYSLVGDNIEIYTPSSFAFGNYDPELGWNGELQTTLTHEYAHMTHAHVFNHAGRMAEWMSEGLAEYVSSTEENIYWACGSARSGNMIPILDESDTFPKQDLMHMYSLEKDFGLSYSFAHSLVAFTVENYGGLDGFWTLAKNLDETDDFKKAVKESFGVSYDQFNQQWQKWLTRQC